METKFRIWFYGRKRNQIKWIIAGSATTALFCFGWLLGYMFNIGSDKFHYGDLKVDESHESGKDDLMNKTRSETMMNGVSMTIAVVWIVLSLAQLTMATRRKVFDWACSKSPEGIGNESELLAFTPEQRATIELDAQDKFQKDSKEAATLRQFCQQQLACVFLFFSFLALSVEMFKVQNMSKVGFMNAEDPLATEVLSYLAAKSIVLHPTVVANSNGSLNLIVVFGHQL